MVEFFHDFDAFVSDFDVGLFEFLYIQFIEVSLTALFRILIIMISLWNSVGWKPGLAAKFQSRCSICLVPV